MSVKGKGARVATLSALTYTTISGAASGAFLALATWKGGYPPVTIYGGAVWVFVLSMIVTMPIVTSYFKRRYKGD